MATPEVQTTRAVEWTLESAGRLTRTITTLPSPASGEILVSTRLGAISPGAERTLLHGAAPSVPDSQYPHQPGYLNVVTIQEAADRTLVGERGVAVLGHRDHALIPYHRFIRMPVGVPDELGLLGILAADASNAIDVAQVESGEDCLVIGGGILGVLTAWELCHRPGVTVRLLERQPRRFDLVKGIRFPGSVSVAEDAGKRQFHTVFDCANSREGFELAQARARRRGSIVVIADGSHEQYTLAGHFFAKGLYLGKTDSHPDLRSFLIEFFARREDRSTLLDTAFQESVSFADFPQAYLKSVLAPPEEHRGLLPRVLYSQ